MALNSRCMPTVRDRRYASARTRLLICVAVLSWTPLMAQSLANIQPSVPSRQTALPQAPEIWSQLRADAVSESISVLNRDKPEDEARLIAVERGPLLQDDTKMPPELQDQIREGIGMVSLLQISTLSFDPFNGP